MPQLQEPREPQEFILKMTRWLSGLKSLPSHLMTSVWSPAPTRRKENLLPLVILSLCLYLLICANLSPTNKQMQTNPKIKIWVPFSHLNRYKLVYPFFSCVPYDKRQIHVSSEISREILIEAMSWQPDSLLKLLKVPVPCTSGMFLLGLSPGILNFQGLS